MKTKNIKKLISLGLLIIVIFLPILYSCLIIPQFSTNQNILSTQGPIQKIPPENQLIDTKQTNMTGWPFKTNGQVRSSPTFGDIDGDDQLEIIFGSGNRIWVVNSTGHNLTYSMANDFPKYAGLPGDLIYSAPAIGDIEGNGNLSIISCTTTGRIYWFNYSWGFPVKNIGNTQSSPVLGDIDSDGELEIIIGDDDGYIWALNLDGTNVTSWPIKTGNMAVHTPSIGDIDGDNQLEIIFGTNDGYVWALNHDGTNVTGWPVNLATSIQSTPALGDIDNDGNLEIVIGSSNPARLWVLKHDGTTEPGWPQIATIQSAPALGDLDNDGYLEIVAAENVNQINAYYYNGTMLSGWPVYTYDFIYGSPIIGEINGDINKEIIFGSGDYIWAVHHTGQNVTGYPIKTGGSVRSTPALADVDDDGLLELFAGSDDTYVWGFDLTKSYVESRLPWPQFHQNSQNTGLYSFDILEMTIETGSGVRSSPTIVDLDDDGLSDVVVGSQDNHIWAFDAKGNNITGWPVDTGGAISLSSPAVGDIDGDGMVEVVVGNLIDNIYAFNHDGTTVTGWPVTTGDWVQSSPALGDIDNDGQLEIVVGSTDNNIYALEGNGSYVTGWPITTGGDIISSPALGDIDNDGQLEIVVNSYDGYIWALESNGNNVTGWPIKTAGLVRSSSALADIDNDGFLEIITGSTDQNIWALNHDGTNVTGWPINIGSVIYSSPALGDLDSDGNLEIVIGDNIGNIWALNHDGTNVTGWPIYIGGLIEGSPALGDIDGEGQLEVVIGSSNDYIWALNHDGTIVNEFPVQTGGDVPSSPAIGNIIDNDLVEIVVGSLDDSIYVLKYTGDFETERFPWPMFQHDCNHTGLYGQPPRSNYPDDILTTTLGTELINWTLWDTIGSGKYRVWANDSNDNYYIWQGWTDWTNNTNLTVTINRTTIGVFNYTIEYNNSKGFIGSPDTVIVTVVDYPSSNQPDDIITSTLGSETIDWMLWDKVGSGKYRVWANDTNDNYYIRQDWTDWTNNSNLAVTINRTVVGIFNYTIEYNNSGGLYGAPDMVIVAVMELPTSNSPNDIVTLTSGSETIDWTLLDSMGPGKYRVWVNDTNDNYYVWIDWTDWTNNSNLMAAINRTATGIFNYTIEYNNSGDFFGNPDTVIVIVVTPPNSNSPSNIITSTLGSETIDWTLWDSVGSGKYRVWANDTNDNYYVWLDWTDWTNNTNLMIDINRTDIGIYNYTIEFNNTGGIFGTPNTVIVTIMELPTSNSPGDIVTLTTGSETIDWILLDSMGSGKYRIWANDTNGNYYVWLDWTDWTNNTNLMAAINRTATGIFNYTIEYNNSGNFFGNPDTVIVNVVTTPTSNSPSNILTSTIGLETIDWFLWDAVGSGKYRVWANDTNNNYYIWQDWTDWTNDSNLMITINRTATGIFNYTIEFNNSASILGTPDMVIVTVVLPPTSNSPLDIQTTTLGTETIDWILWDAVGPAKFIVIANDTNDVMYIWQGWTDWINNTNLLIPINRTATGVFRYLIIFNNSYGIYGITDEVIVTITLPQPPTSNQPANFNSELSGSETIDWILWDSVGPGKYRILVNDSNDNYYVWIDWTDWINNTNLMISLNRSVTGVFNYTIEYNNSYGLLGIVDTVIITITEEQPSQGLDPGLLLGAASMAGGGGSFFTSPIFFGVIGGIAVVVIIIGIVVSKKSKNGKKIFYPSTSESEK